MRYKTIGPQTEPGTQKSLDAAVTGAASSDDGEERGSVKQLKILTPPSVCSSAAPVERTAVEQTPSSRTSIEREQVLYAEQDAKEAHAAVERAAGCRTCRSRACRADTALMPSSVSPSSLPPMSVPPSSVLLWREEVECRVYTAAEVMMPLLFCRK